MARKTVELEVKEMTNADASFISIVKRGAMRVPFRILKSEETGMINLGQLWTKKAEPSQSPSIVAVVVPMGSDVDGLKASLLERGVTVVKTETREDAKSEVLVIKDDFDSEDILTFKMSENVGVIMEGVKKSFSPYGCEGTSFLQNLQAQGFYPGLDMAMSCLFTTIMNCLDEGEMGMAPTEEINKAVDEFAAYVKALAASIPVVAFKADSMVKKAEVEAPATEEVAKEETTAAEEPVAKEETTTDSATDGDADKGAVTKEEGATETPATEEVAKGEEEGLIDTAVAPVAKSEEPAATETVTKSDEVPAEGEPAATSEASVATTDSAPTTQEATPSEAMAAFNVLAERFESFMGNIKGTIQEAMAGELQTVVAKVDEVKEQFDTLSQEVGSLKEAVVKAEEVATKAAEAVQGTVIGGDSAEDKIPVTKAAPKQDAGLFDTAFKFPGLEN